MASLGALVIELAANTARLQGDLGRAVSMAEGAARKFKSVFGGLIGLSGGGLFAAVIKGAIQFGDEMGKAAQKSGIGVRAFSELAYAAKQNNIEMTELSAAIRKMQISLSGAASGGKAQNAVLRALGLTIQEIKTLAPEQQFELLADRINQLSSPADRARAAVELFGKAGADLLPLFVEGAQGIQKLRREAEKMGKTLDEQGAKTLKEAADAVGRLKASWEGFAQTLAIKVAPILSSVLDTIRQGTGFATDQESLERLKKIRDNILSGVGGDRSRFPSAGQELKNLQELERQIETIEARIRTQSSPAVQGSVTKLLPGFEDTDALEKQAKETLELLDFIQEASNDVRDQVHRDAMKMADDRLDEGAALVKSRDEMMNKEQEYLAFVGEFYAQLDEETRTSAEKQARALEDFKTKLDILVSEGLDPDVAKARMEEFKRSFDEMSTFADQAARNMQDAFANFLFDPFEDGLKGMLKGFIDILRRMIAEAAAAKIFETLFGKPGAGNILGSVLGAIFGGGKSGGKVLGPLATGTNYVPVDNFPALLHKGEAVVPAKYNPAAGGGGGNVTITNHIDARGATADAIALLPEVLRRNNEALKADIIDGFRRRRYAL